MAYVYRHIRLDKNEVFYVGIGIRENYRRARTIVQRNANWKNIVAKTGWISEIMFDDITIEEAKKKEIEFISIYGRSDLGLGSLVNMTNGGDGTLGVIISPEKKIQMSIRNLGKTLSREHKNKISDAHKGKVFSSSTLKKMSEAKLGKPQSAERVEKRRIKLIGNKSRTGQKATPEMIAKLKAGQIARRLREKSLVNGTPKRDY